MGNLLLRILLAVTVLILIVLAIGSLLPRDYNTEATITIEARADEIFPLINRLKSWPRWSNWNMHDIPSLKIEYGGQESGVGAVQRWTEPRGSGKLWITRSVLNERIEYESEFAKFPLMTSSIDLDGNPPTETVVVWNSSGSLPSGPFYGWFGGLFSNALQADYDKSLRRLKKLVESKGKDENPNSEND